MITTITDHKERIEEIEKELTALQEERVSLLKESARMDVQNYPLLRSDGTSTNLAALFGDSNELLVIHNMGKSCSYCTLWADGLNGFAKPLADRAGFVVISPDAPEVQQEFAQSRGWTFPMASGHGSSFISDMGFAYDRDGKTWYVPGFSAFKKNEDGSIVRTGLDVFGPGDVYCSVWHLFSMFENGAGNWNPKYNYA